MWNWKLIYQDAELAFFCDIDNITDPETEEDGLYAPVECCRAIPERAACITSLHPKKEDIRDWYVKGREARGLETAGYDRYAYTLCVVELDRRTRKYRIIPAMDCDGTGAYMGVSSLFHETESPAKGLSTEWSPVGSPKTHKAVRALYKFIYPSATR